MSSEVLCIMTAVMAASLTLLAAWSVCASLVVRIITEGVFIMLRNMHARGHGAGEHQH